MKRSPQPSSQIARRLLRPAMILAIVALAAPAAGGNLIAGQQTEAAPVNTAPPAISGQARTGSTLTSSTGTWTSGTTPTFAYQWKRCDSAGSNCASFPGERGATYTIVSGDAGSTIRIVVTATNSGGSATATARTNVVSIAPPVNTTLPAISGLARLASSVTSSSGVWTSATTPAYAYEWKRCDSAGANCAAIAGQTSSSYTLVAVDVGLTVRVVVTASNSGGTATATARTNVVSGSITAPVNTLPPTISGQAQTGSTLTSTTGTWTSAATPTYSYQWKRCDSAGANCAAIAGQTSSTYTLVSADAGSTVRIVVTATNSGGSATATARTNVVTDGNPPPPPPPSSVLWSADHETGNLEQWRYPGGSDYGGGFYLSGQGDASISTDYAHSGQYSARERIFTPNSPTSGVRAFRWKESRATREAYYSAWFYFPTLPTLTANPNTGQFWNIFQFKSSATTSSASDPLWFISVYNNTNGALVPHLIWWSTTLTGPHQGETGFKDYSPTTPATVPIGQWVHYEAFLRQSKDYDGKLTFWQNGTKIFDMTNIRTSYDNAQYNPWHTDNAWSVNNYSDGISINPYSLYIDDAAISTTYIP